MSALLLTVLILGVAGLLVTGTRKLGVGPFGAAGAWIGAGQTSASDLDLPLSDIDRGLKDLGEHIEAVRFLAEERGTQIERFREGYDYAITRSFARGVIKAIDMIGDFQRQLTERHGATDSPVLADALNRLEATAGQLTLLLEANCVESFIPEPGEAIADDSRRYEPVEKCPTERVEDHGHVAEVKYPGWIVVLGESEERVIREAQVSVFVPIEEGSDPR